ncbi:MAG TPA: hypothetical protein VFJ72_05205 [Rubrobacteraceae bacterium]|nr:hypothetical protein [Rubrobacteraceae bacterium]
MARLGERYGDASGAGAPFDDGTGLASGEGVPEGQVVVVDVLQVIEVGQRVVFLQEGLLGPVR